MAVQTKVGSFSKPVSATGAQAITGLGFTPKAIIFWATGSALAAGSWASHIFATLGYTAGPTSSYAVASMAYDNQTTTEANRRIAQKCITFLNEPAFNNKSEADLASFDADGFTLNWTANELGTAFVIHYMAFGGSDITDAKVILSDVPAALGSQVVSGVGFKPDLVFHATSDDVAGSVPISTPHAFLGNGAMNRYAEQHAASFAIVDTGNPADGGRMQVTDACIATSRWGEVVRNRASFVSMNDDGFTLNWSVITATTKYISLCLKGIDSRIGGFIKNISANPTTQIIDNLGFTPRGVMVGAYQGSPQNTAQPYAFWSYGATDGTTQRAAILQSFDGASPTNIKNAYYNDCTLIEINAGNPPTVASKGSAALGTDSFTLTLNPNYTAGAGQFLYFAVGDAPAPAPGVKTKVGSFAKQAGSGLQKITGLGFRPKSIIFWSARTNTPNTWITDIYTGIGFTAGPSNSHAVCMSSRDNLSTASTYRRAAAKAFTQVDANGGVHEADLASFDADGFTLNWGGNSSGVDQQIMYMAIGGDEVSARIVSWTTPATPGAAAVAGVGFKPDLVMHTSNGLSSNVHTGTGLLCLGMMNKEGQQWANSIIASTQGSAAPSNTSRWQQADACILRVTNNETAETQAHFQSMDADGFTTYFSAAAGIVMHSLALKGVSSKLGSFTAPGFVEEPAANRVITQATGIPYATANPGQRKLDRCQDGTLWYMPLWSDTGARFFYSKDNGETWTYNVTSIDGVTNGSIFIDLDDYMHVVWKQSGTFGGRTDGAIYYVRGTPNEGRTKYTWGTPVALNSTGDTGMSSYDQPDLVVHREGTGWAVHIVASFAASNPINYALYHRLSITSAGVVSKVTPDIDFASGTGNEWSYISADGVTVNAATYPSIDFHHTGDGKTVKDGTPHLYVAWSSGINGSGRGIRFRKATYSGGAWAWGTQASIRAIDEAVYVNNALHSLLCVWDGTAVLIGGTWTTYGLRVIESTNDFTTAGTVIVTTSPVLGEYGQVFVADADRNLHLISSHYGASQFDRVEYRKWTRVGAALSAAETVSSYLTPNHTYSHYPSIKRGYQNDRVEFVYTTGTGAPYSVRYGAKRISDGELLPLVRAERNVLEKVGFRPRGILFSDVDALSNSNQNPNSGLYWNMAGTDGVTQRTVSIEDLDAQNPTSVRSAFYNDRVINHFPGSGIASVKVGTVEEIDDEGFTIKYTPSNTSQSQHQYLALGDAAKSTFPTRVEGNVYVKADATAFGNQRKLDRCQNGVLWTLIPHNTGSPNLDQLVMAHSTDGGSVWTQATGAIHANAYANNGSLFIDVDDYAHVVWQQAVASGSLAASYIYYMRGTPNAGRTAWTWSAPVQVNSAANVYYNYPDLVAHKEGTGWVAHVMLSYSGPTGDNYAVYNRLTISNTGTIVNTGQDLIGGNYAVGTSLSMYPSIDFNHTGDGKTIAGGTPHLYAAWSSGNFGAGRGIRFRKATYSGGSWTWGTEREIDNAYRIGDTIGDWWLNCLFDGTRVIIGGFLTTGSGSHRFILWERDAADTTTTELGMLLASTNDWYFVGSLTYDASGNIYIFHGENGTAALMSLCLTKWTRSTWSFGSRQTIDFANTRPYVSAKRGYSGNKIEWVYMTGGQTPYSLKYDRLVASLGYYVPQIML